MIIVQRITKASENFNFLHYNVWSLLADGRLDVVKMICMKYSIDVLVLSESKLDESIPDNLVEITGIRRDKNINGGGVIIYSFPSSFQTYGNNAK